MHQRLINLLPAVAGFDGGVAYTGKSGICRGKLFRFVRLLDTKYCGKSSKHEK